MLGYEHRMPPHGSLLPILLRIRRSQSLGNKLCRMASDHLQSLLIDVRLVLF